MKRRLTIIATTLAVMLGVSLVGVPNASAIISSWTYIAGGGFCTFTPPAPPANQVTPSGTSSVLSPGAPCSTALGSPLPTTLSWGTPIPPGGQSALILTEPVSGTVFTGGLAAPDITITHRNQEILDFAPGALTSASILGSLALVPAPGGSPFIVPFQIAFKETLNAPPCPTGSSAVPCDDIFVLLNPTTLQNNFTGPDGLPYTLTLNIVGLGTLQTAPDPNGPCTLVGQPVGCQGILTAEFGNRDIPTNFTITSAIPEPSTLLLLGSGLAALSLYTRKKAKRTV